MLPASSVTDAEEDVLALEVMAEMLAHQAALRELSECGLVASPADAAAWRSADRRTRERLARPWAAMAIQPPPDWKCR